MGRPKATVNDTKYFNPVADLIRINRLKKGLSLEDVAKICGFSLYFLSNIERGRAPFPVEKINRVAKLLNISKKELFIENLFLSSSFKNFLNASKFNKKKIKNSLIKMKG